MDNGFTRLQWCSVKDQTNSRIKCSNKKSNIFLGFILIFLFIGRIKESNSIPTFALSVSLNPLTAIIVFYSVPEPCILIYISAAITINTQTNSELIMPAARVTPTSDWLSLKDAVIPHNTHNLNYLHKLCPVCCWWWMVWAEQNSSSFLCSKCWNIGSVLIQVFIGFPHTFIYQCCGEINEKPL